MQLGLAGPLEVWGPMSLYNPALENRTQGQMQLKLHATAIIDY